MSTSPTNSQRGSVIIWILIAVAMFAALSFAVANMMRGGGSNITTELTRTHASEIMSYGEGLRRAVQTIRAGGTGLSSISFQNDFVSGYANSNCTDDTCRVFMPMGGGLSYANPLPDWIDVSREFEPYYGEWHFAPDSCIPNVGTGGAGCGGDSIDNEDLIAFLPYIKRSLCVEINRQIGIGNAETPPPADTGCPWTSGSAVRYTGSFTDAEEISHASLENRQTGCFQIGACAGYTAGSYIYYQVLVPR